MVEGAQFTRTDREWRCSDGGASLLHPSPRWQSARAEDRGKRATVAIFRRSSPSPFRGEGRGPRRRLGKGEGVRRPDGDQALERARDLRRFSTDAEKILWSALRNRRVRGAKFRRQVWLNGFIADFFCAEARLVIEADGGHHAEQRDYDDRRAETLRRGGFRVIRFWNNDIMENLDGVVAAISEALTLPPSDGWRAPPSPLKGEGL